MWVVEKGWEIVGGNSCEDISARQVIEVAYHQSILTCRRALTSEIIRERRGQWLQELHAVLYNQMHSTRYPSIRADNEDRLYAIERGLSLLHGGANPRLVEKAIGEEFGPIYR